jgi:hypothetical protein
MLSKRERIIGIAAVLILSALVGDRFILTPTIRRLGVLEDTKQVLLAELNEAQNLFERRRLMEKRWKELLGDGLKNESQAESRILHAVDDWARQSRFTLTSVKPERLSEVKSGLKEMTFTIAGTGSLESTGEFLMQVETASVPVKIKDIQLGSANETGDNMSLQLLLSSLYVGGQEGASGGQDDQNG